MYTGETDGHGSTPRSHGDENTCPLPVIDTATVSTLKGTIVSSSCVGGSRIGLSRWARRLAKKGNVFDEEAEDHFSVVTSDDEMLPDHGRVDSEDEVETEDESETVEVTNVPRPQARDPFFDFNSLEFAVMPTQEEIEEDKWRLDRDRERAILRGESEESWIMKTVKTIDVESESVDAVSDKLPAGMELIGDGEWVRIKGGMTLDSGCSVFVMPSKWLRHLKLEPSEGSRRGQNFVAASNHSLRNEGQRTVRFRTVDGSRRQMVFQVAAVNKILASIAGICDNGNSVNFRRDGGTTTHDQSGRETHFRRQGNVYVMDMWVRNPALKGEVGKQVDFARHGRGN